MSKKNSMYKNGKQRQTLCLAAVSLSFFFIFLFCTQQGEPALHSRGLFAAGSIEASTGAPENDAGGSQGIPGKARRPRRIPEDWTLTIISTGDVMMHSPQTNAGRLPDGVGYDFGFMFEKVAPILQGGDLVIGNLETPLAGAANGGFTGYPMFNAPEALARNLKDAGFTLVSTANNHSLDRQFQGLCATLDNLDDAGLMHTGTYRSLEEQSRILHFSVKGVRFAVIAATYGANGLTLPRENSYALDFIHEEKLLGEIRQAREEGAQYVILLFHWGVEYQASPNKEQAALAVNLLRGGADLILGNHPHVLQRGEMIHYGELFDSADLPVAYRASGKDQYKFVMYSQGNFVSNQEGLDRLCSLLLKLTIGVDGATGEPYLKEAGYIPIYTQKRDRLGYARHTVWPLELAFAEMESGRQTFGAADRADIPRAWESVIKSQPAIDLLTLEGTPVWEELQSTSRE
ncbi:MAG: CapA family protein [Clostridiales bacterium]|nr:CapA family protein [Clostridiales bacterium]